MAFSKIYLRRQKLVNKVFYSDLRNLRKSILHDLKRSTQFSNFLFENPPNEKILDLPLHSNINVSFLKIFSDQEFVSVVSNLIIKKLLINCVSLEPGLTSIQQKCLSYTPIQKSLTNESHLWKLCDKQFAVKKSKSEEKIFLIDNLVAKQKKFMTERKNKYFFLHAAPAQFFYVKTKSWAALRVLKILCEGRISTDNKNSSKKQATIFNLWNFRNRDFVAMV